MPKVRKAELSFLYISSYSTFLPNTIKIFQGVFELQSEQEINFKNKTKGDNSKSKKARVVILVRDTSSQPILHFYQVS